MAKEKQRIFITGASGFSGMHACAHFEEQGFEVYGLARKNQHINGCGQLIQCDLTDASDVLSAIKKVNPDLVLHLAGQNSVAESWKDPGSYIHSNVLGTVHLLEAIRAHNHEAKILVAGSMLQEPAETSSHPYALSKTMQMLVARAWEKLFQMKILLVKPCNLIGPGPSNGVCSIFAQKIARMETGVSGIELSVDSLGTKRDFLDVRDAIKAYQLLLLNGQSGQIYELGTGKFISLGEIIDHYRQLSDVPFTIMETRPEVFQPSSLQKYGNLNLLRELGWAPEIALQQSLADILDYHRSRQEGSNHV